MCCKMMSLKPKKYGLSIQIKCLFEPAFNSNDFDCEAFFFKN